MPQEIAEEMGHTAEVLGRTYAHVIVEYRGQGLIGHDALIQRARGIAKPPQSRPGPVYQPLDSEADRGDSKPPTHHYK
jgi:hypothetical protein